MMLKMTSILSVLSVPATIPAASFANLPGGDWTIEAYLTWVAANQPAPEVAAVVVATVQASETIDAKTAFETSDDYRFDDDRGIHLADFNVPLACVAAYIDSHAANLGLWG